MTCTHLKQLYQLCHDSQIQLSSTDLIHIVCKQCENVEVCPSVLYEDYDKMPEYKTEPSSHIPPLNPTPAGPSGPT